MSTSYADAELQSPSDTDLADEIKSALTSGFSVELLRKPTDASVLIVRTWFGKHCNLSQHTKVEV
jgi:hypothetical protein